MSLINQNVRNAVEEVLRAAQVPGMVLAVARGDRPAEFLAIGEDALGRPLAHDTLFPVASITKLATALAVLRLAEEGALTLDDQLSEHLPEALAAQHGVTIRALLCHTGGLQASLMRCATWCSARSASRATWALSRRVRWRHWPTCAAASVAASWSRSTPRSGARWRCPGRDY